MKYLAGFFIFLLSVGNAHAAREWLFNDVIVEDVGIYSKVISGNSYTVMYVELSGISDQDCAPTNEHGVVHNLVSGVNFGGNMQMRYSTLLSAQAQGTPVDILVDTSSCNTNSNWNRNSGSPGLGRQMVGVVIDGGQPSP